MGSLRDDRMGKKAKKDEDEEVDGGGGTMVAMKESRCEDEARAE